MISVFSPSEEKFPRSHSSTLSMYFVKRRIDVVTFSRKIFMGDEGWRRRVSVCRKWILSCSWWCDIILYGLFLYFYFQFELKFPYVTWFADVFFLIFVILHLQHFRGLSFRTISSVGPHGAIIHYSPNPKTCSELDPDSIYLCDSGGQVHLSYSFIV